MRQAVFHIGSMKTGSTSAQDTFRKAREALAEHGFHYASVSRNHAFLTFIMRFADRMGLENAEENWTSPLARQALDQLKLAKAETAHFEEGTFLFSSESLFKATRKRAGILKDVAEDMFPDIPVRILAYIRHPVGYTISNAQERIKRTYATSEDVESEGYDGHLRRGIEVYRDTFGHDALIVRSYDEAVADKGKVEDDILAALGHADATSVIESAYKNTSLSMNAVQVADVVNVALKAENLPHDRPRRTAKDHALRKLKGPKFAFRAEALEHLHEQCAPDVEWFRSTFGLALREPKLATREELSADLYRDKKAVRKARAVIDKVKAVEPREPRRVQEREEELVPD